MELKQVSWCWCTLCEAPLREVAHVYKIPCMREYYPGMQKLLKRAMKPPTTVMQHLLQQRSCKL
jgi:hypothetical protein